MDKYPKRLIEVNLPIKRISVHARREKSVGHISSLHVWWSKKPLASCRATMCATLWPDPADELCPEMFRKISQEQMTKWAKDHLDLVSADSMPRFVSISKNERRLDDMIELRAALLDFIADFAYLKNACRKEFFLTAQELTKAAHAALSNSAKDRPIVLDPFAGGGSIPVEALRIGAEVFASDLNPIPVLINKALIEFIPKYSEQLKNRVIEACQWTLSKARIALSEYYPSGEDGRTAIAYLWSKTVTCEGPNCGIEIPMLPSLWLEKKGTGKKYLSLKPIYTKDKRYIDVDIVSPVKMSEPTEGTVKRGSVVCPVCGYTIPRSRVEVIACEGKLGERMVAVVSTKKCERGRFYEKPSDSDLVAIEKVEARLARICNESVDGLSIIPDEELPYLRSIFNVHIYGINKWSLLFNPRQLLTCLTFVQLLKDLRMSRLAKKWPKDILNAVNLFLAFAIDRQINALNRTCYWNSTGAKMQAGFARQALPMFWNHCEANPFGGSVGSWDSMIKFVLCSFDAMDGIRNAGTVQQASATEHPLPDDSVEAVFTDPPYYDQVPYANLSDFFYIWLKRMLASQYPELFSEVETPKELEVVQLAERNPKYRYKTKERFEYLMTKSLKEARRIAKPTSVSVVVFAHQTTTGWEAMLSALINAGWVVTASWPIDTEMPTRVRATNSAVLASSIHLVCRPRENPDGKLRTDDVGDWRDVLAELPNRIHEWMPRLAEEGVVGADAIFACLGPALEIYSRYSSVEKASGEKVELKEYLEQVWAAVSREALKMIFEGADASGFEEDARLTAMWLWTLRTSRENGGISEDDEEKTKSITGYDLEYDAARKIAQGLGAHLENLGHLVNIKGVTATLLSAGARTRYLFGKDAGEAPKGKKRIKSKQQKFDFMGELKELEEVSGDWAGDLSGRAGSTVLDQLHQSMILFGAGRGEALKRFLVDDGIGMNPLYWRLAQALSALYPSGTDEKRWVDGVLARKKGLGF